MTSPHFLTLCVGGGGGSKCFPSPSKERSIKFLPAAAQILAQSPNCPSPSRKLLEGARLAPRRTPVWVAPGAGASALGRGGLGLRARSPGVSALEKREPALAGVAAGGGIRTAGTWGARAGLDAVGLDGRQRHADVRAQCGSPHSGLPPPGALSTGAVRPDRTAATLEPTLQ